jgi:hypothetical protein
MSAMSNEPMPELMAESVEHDPSISPRHCDWCGAWTYRNRFCSVGCSIEFFQAERRQAIAWFRASGMKVQREQRA